MVCFPEKEYTVHHTRSHFELHSITEGSAVYTMNFREEIVLHAGEWLLINKTCTMRRPSPWPHRDTF
ncbi:MAG: AraC family ligand binding domain-containing protein [Clostridia bacterium]|nr:AraC family ligand binding domain-containing protein [Clostridia bacterium]